MHFHGYFALSHGPNWEVICIILIFGVIFSQHLGIWPTGWPYIGIPPTVWQFILKKYHHALLWMYFYGYFALSHGPNWEVICIIPIFGVIFGHNLGIWPPGVALYSVTPTILQLILNKYYHDLSWMYFCGYFALSNGPNWEVICLIPIFGVIFGHNFGIWPPGVSLYSVTTRCYAINFE